MLHTDTRVPTFSPHLIRLPQLMREIGRNTSVMKSGVGQIVFVLASRTLLIDISLDIIRLTSHSSLKRSSRKEPMPS